MINVFSIDGVSDAADYQFRHVLGDRFERFQVPLESAGDAMDKILRGSHRTPNV